MPRRLWAAARPGSSGIASWLNPNATFTLTKSGINPTFNFAGFGSGPTPENIVKVGSTYYAVYGSVNIATIGLASASSPAGPWTDLGSILSGVSQAWEYDGYSAPFILEDDGLFYLYYSSKRNSDNAGAIGCAIASSITGPYTKYAGNPVLSPSAGSGWDSRLVGEPTLVKVSGRYYLGFTAWDSLADLREKVGFGVGDSPLGPFTKAAGNPLLGFGPGGAWDDALTADSHIFYVDGLFWAWYTGARAGSGPWKAGLAWAADPMTAWTRLAGNPLLTLGGGGSFDEIAAWRGCVFPEDRTLHVIYGGINGANTQVRGGNAIITLS